MKEEIGLRLAGSGGQGVILGSIILADAALANSYYSAQSQSYGPEARGGMCKAEVIISKHEIDFPKVEKPDVLLALTQAALDRYTREMGPDCTVVADSSLSLPYDRPNTYFVPILETAREVVHNPMTSNVVALGALNSLAHLVDEESLERAVLKYVPKGAREVNSIALKEGERLTADIRPAFHMAS